MQAALSMFHEGDTETPLPCSRYVGRPSQLGRSTTNCNSQSTTQESVEPTVCGAPTPEGLKLNKTTKRQPWMNFISLPDGKPKPNDHVAWIISQGGLVGGDEVRLLGELDDKDLGEVKNMHSVILLC